jgi:ribonuclease VapC
LAAEAAVLDSYAILAFLEGAPGWRRARDILQKAQEGCCTTFMSVVNLGEVLYITERERGLERTQETLARLDELPIELVDVDREQTLTASHIKAEWPIAYADCFCAALAVLKDATIVTGDPEFKSLEEASVVSIHWITRTSDGKSR